MASGGALFSYERADCSRFVSSGKIEFESLSEIENNLTDCEKVSLVFLLYDEVNVAIERLEMLVGDCVKDSRHMNLLEDWAKGGEQQYWKETLLEGLAIIKAYKVVKDLNYYPQQVNDRFSPDQLDKSIFIHPVKKALFGMCEEFLIKDTEKFIRDVLDSSKIAIQNRFNYMELFLLHMMKNEMITVGTWSPLEMTQEKSNLDIISNYLKMNKFFQLYDVLNSVEYFVNNTSNNETDAENVSKSTTSMNETSVLYEEDNIYPILDVTSLGWFLIFNHKNFVTSKPELIERLGTEKDVIELEKCWSSYGFTPVVFNDLKAYDVLKEIKKYTECVEDKHSAFGVCILSNGDNRGVFASDGQHLEIDVIKNLLETKNLIDRPKILLVQACRGEKKMKYYEVEYNDNLEADGPPNVHEKADLIVFYATVEEFVSYRHRVDGSLFINALCECLTKYGNKYHLLDIFIKVTEIIANKGYQISQHTSTFRKYLFLKGSQYK